MQLYIITGTTSGLGEAMAKRLLASGRSVISVSRTLNESLTEYANEKGAILTEYLCDLRDTPNLVPFMERIMGMIDVSQLSSVTLVNNAGVLNPIMPLEQAGSEELTDHLHINLLAPMLLTSAFIRATGSWPVTVSKTVVNISSGAGKKPYSGWSAYCTAKAGIDMMTRCAGQEQGDGPGAVKLVSIAPGVVETRMQEQIRKTAPQRFPEVGRFIGLKASGKLYLPDEAAERIISILDKGGFGQGDVIDVRNYSGPAR